MKKLQLKTWQIYVIAFFVIAVLNHLTRMYLGGEWMDSNLLINTVINLIVLSIVIAIDRLRRKITKKKA